MQLTKLGGRAPKLAVDAAGGAATGWLAGTLATGSRALFYGLTSGEDHTVDTGLIVSSGIRIEGFWMPWSMCRIDPEVLRIMAAESLHYVREGDIDVPIEARYELDEIGAMRDHTG